MSFSRLLLTCFALWDIYAIWSDLICYNFSPHNWMAFVHLNKRHVQWVSMDGWSHVTAGVVLWATISRIVWEFVEGFLERISRLFGSGGGRKSVPICYCPWEKWEFIGFDVRWHNSKCISSTVSSTPYRMLEFIHEDSCQTTQTLVEQRQTSVFPSVFQWLPS